MDEVVQNADQPSLRVLLAEPNEMVRAALRNLLPADQRFVLVGEALFGVPEMAHRLHPDLTIVGAGPSGQLDPRLVVELRGASPNSRVVALADSTEFGAFMDVMLAGARAYLLRSSLTEAMLRKVLVCVGRFAVHVTDANLAPGFANRDRALLLIGRESQPELPSRERVVLERLAAGTKDEEIAAQLGISPSTVRDHVHLLCRKLEVQTRFQLGAAAARAGLL